MTSKELDERIEKLRSLSDAHYVADWSASPSTSQYLTKYQEYARQLIRDCIEAVTPDKSNDQSLMGSVHNGAIDTIKANTKELLG